jgi:hypothetical protein
MSITKLQGTPENIILALDIHKSNGLIRDWQQNANAQWRKGGTERPFYLFADLANGDTIELRNLREARVFVAGLASAYEAMLRKEGGS